MKRWHVIVLGPKLIDDLRKAPDDVLSFHEATREVRRQLVLYVSQSLTMLKDFLN